MENQTDTQASPSEAPAAPEATPEAEVSTDGSALGGGAPAEAGAEEKPTEAKEPATEDAPRAPEKYDFKLEGVELDATLLAEAEPILRKLDLDNDQANEFLPIANKVATAAHEKTLKELNDAGQAQKADWLKISKEDEVIGGANWENTTSLAAKAMDALGFEEGHPFRTALNETGFGNNRDMLFAFSKFGELVGEDGFERGQGGAKADVPTEQRWYGNKGG